MSRSRKTGLGGNRAGRDRVVTFRRRITRSMKTTQIIERIKVSKKDQALELLATIRTEGELYQFNDIANDTREPIEDRKASLDALAFFCQVSGDKRMIKIAISKLRSISIEPDSTIGNKPVDCVFYALTNARIKVQVEEDIRKCLLSIALDSKNLKRKLRAVDSLFEACEIDGIDVADAISMMGSVGAKTSDLRVGIRVVQKLEEFFEVEEDETPKKPKKVIKQLAYVFTETGIIEIADRAELVLEKLFDDGTEQEIVLMRLEERITLETWERLEPILTRLYDKYTRKYEVSAFVWRILGTLERAETREARDMLLRADRKTAHVFRQLALDTDNNNAVRLASVTALATMCRAEQLRAPLIAAIHLRHLLNAGRMIQKRARETEIPAAIRETPHGPVKEILA